VTIFGHDFQFSLIVLKGAIRLCEGAKSYDGMRLSHAISEYPYFHEIYLASSYSATATISLKIVLAGNAGGPRRATKIDALFWIALPEKHEAITPTNL
jgi:hypothetical protein